jgi:Ni,Fe-hydrogenase maturation factor
VDTAKTPKEKIVLGLGNTLRGDDGIGILVTTELETKFHNRAEFVCYDKNHV